MKNYLHYLCLTLTILILTLLTEQLQAQPNPDPDLNRAQVMGGDISYWRVDTNEYRFEVNLYYYCPGDSIIPKHQINLQITSPKLGIQDTMVLLSGTAKEITPVCPDYLERASCRNPGSQYPGVKQYEYHSYDNTITLPPSDDWRISFVDNDRNAYGSHGITNLDMSSVSTLNNKFYLYATINNSDPSQYTDSLVFTTPPISFYCNNINSEFKQGVIHNSNNGKKSLVYDSVNPLAENATPIAYKGGFNENRPLEANIYNFDHETGGVNFTPNAAQFSVMTILVQEHAEDGTLLGSVTRDVQIVVIDGCSSEEVKLREPTYFFQDGCADSLLNFDIVAQDFAGSGLTIQHNIDSHFPTNNPPSLTINSNNNGILNANFNWQPDASQIGEYTLLVTISNNECPIPSTSTEAISILVAEPGDVFIDSPPQQHCRNSPTQLRLCARGCGSFEWRSTDSADEFESVNGGKCRMVTLDNTSGLHTYCVRNTASGKEDCTQVEIIDDFDININYDQVICKGESTNIQSIPTVGSTNDYTYQWLNDPDLSCNDCPNPILTPDVNQSYIVTVSNAAGCEIEKTIIVEVENATVDIVGASSYMTMGEEVNLEVQGDFDTILGWQIESPEQLYTYADAKLQHTIDGNSNITVNVATANGCTASQTIFIQTREPEFMTPTAFSPNEDGMNEIFKLNNPQQFAHCDQFEFCIFDRWGTEVFRTYDISEGWAGNYNSQFSDQKQANVGTYVYYMKAYCGDEEELVKKQGTVTLIR